ncbi:MAG: hypothetical protein HON53_06015, partial [Planctomycetaceae bacterium]|nr:hypothetical protein [Planctomycetaceae bacterium]
MATASQWATKDEKTGESHNFLLIPAFRARYDSVDRMVSGSSCADGTEVIGSIVGRRGAARSGRVSFAVGSNVNVKGFAMNVSSVRVACRGVALAVPMACLVLVCSGDAMAVKRSKAKRPITKLSLDPTAKSVELFAGMEKGLLDVKAIPKDSKKGNLLIENKTDKPLTVQMPDAFVGVQVLKQIGGMGGMG